MNDAHGNLIVGPTIWTDDGCCGICGYRPRIGNRRMPESRRNWTSYCRTRHEFKHGIGTEVIDIPNGKIAVAHGGWPWKYLGKRIDVASAFCRFLSELAHGLAVGKTKVDLADSWETGAYRMALLVCSTPQETAEVMSADTRWREFTDPAWQSIVATGRW